jgi:hypothetical protein
VASNEVASDSPISPVPHKISTAGATMLGVKAIVHDATNPHFRFDRALTLQRSGDLEQESAKYEWH